MTQQSAARRRAVTIAGHTGDADTALRALSDPDSSVRAAGLGALERLAQLADGDLAAALADPDLVVRRRAVEIAAKHRDIDLLGALDDPDPRVVEIAAWSCGEHESNRDEIVERLLGLAADSDEPLVRESAVAALGAIGDERAVDAIIAACADKPAVRRRAVLALAPFIDDDPDNDVGQRVDATIERALEDRDWQVRQAAEDLRRITAAK
jgi:HEAT repeat protein